MCSVVVRREGSEGDEDRGEGGESYDAISYNVSGR